MDDKVSRRKQPEVPRRANSPAQRFGRRIWSALSTHRSLLLSIILLAIIAVLLPALLSQLPAPRDQTVPAGETEIAYSAFLEQIQAGNVRAVALQDQALNALLAHPISVQTAQGQQPTQHPPVSTSPDPVLWMRAQHTGTASTNATANTQFTIFVRIPAGMSGSLVRLLTEQHIMFTTVQLEQNFAWLEAIWRILPVILLAGLLLFWMQRRSPFSARGIDNRISRLGKSGARRIEQTKEQAGEPSTTTGTLKKSREANEVTESASATLPVSTTSARISSIPQVTFADVAGIDEVRVELEEIVEFLRTPERFNRLGAHIPRGALLIGQPGTGKTLLAKAVAGEAGVPFFSISASEFVEVFVGVGASRVRDLFSQARKASPCVVFIDEIDAVGRKRSLRATSSDERDQTLNQLLVELDGFDERQAIVVLAATNRADILDAALLRPGRFDRHITVLPPDRNGREAILKVHTRNVPLHEDVELAQLARITPGMTGADLANLVNEAALTAARKDLERVDMLCFEEALARVQLGALRPLVMSEEEKQVIAVHESGHALVAYHLPEADPVNRVTILPRGQSLGVTQFSAETDRYNYSRETLMARIAVALGGRAAEELVSGPERVTTGAENDLQVVTGLARRMVTRWGMSKRVGLVFADSTPEMDYNVALRQIDPITMPMQTHALIADVDGSLQLNGFQPTAQHTLALSRATFSNRNSVTLNALIDEEVQSIVHDGYMMARRILAEHADQLTLLTQALLEREQLDRKQFEELLASASY